MPNTIILRGDNFVRREDNSQAVVTPGMLLEFNANDKIQKHSVSNGRSAKLFALEADYIGNTVTTDYVAGDRVPYAACGTGTVVWAHLASGQNVQRGDFLSSNGAGFLTAYGGTAPPVAMADEDADASTGVAASGSLRFRAEVV